MSCIATLARRMPSTGPPIDRLGTHTFKRSAMTLMKDTCTSTALVGAIAGTTAKTLDRIYDAPTWRRQQTLAVRAFTQVATALQPAAPAAAEEGPPAGGQVLRALRPSSRRGAVGLLPLVRAQILRARAGALLANLQTRACVRRLP